MLISSFQIIECQDGKFRAAKTIYFANEENKSLLGENVHYVDPEKKHSNEVLELYKCLRISDRPKIEDLIQVINKTVEPYPSKKTSKFIIDILIHIGSRFSDFENSPKLSELKSKAWLPVENESLRWYQPQAKDLFAPNNKHLFETTGKFLDLSKNDGQKIFKLISYLGIKIEPTVKQVVDHLINMSVKKEPVSREVYKFLEQNHEDHVILELKNKACILTANNTYISPNKVFWSDHPFGSYRQRLGEKMEEYKKLFDILGVKKEPDYEDAIEVLKEVSEKFTLDQLVLDEESQNVVRHCWIKLNDEPKERLLTLKNQKVVLTNSNRLDSPNNIYFDDFPNIAEKLGLANQAIARPTDYWKPLEKAGVRFLSKSVKTTIVKTENEREDNRLTEKLKCGFECISWLVEAARKDNELPCETSHLEILKIIKTDELLVKYSIPETNFTSSSDLIDALYDSEKQIVYFFTQSPNFIESISREIARSISTQIEVIALSLGINVILTSENLDEAKNKLNALGLSIVDSRKVEQAKSSSMPELGGTTDEETENTKSFNNTNDRDDENIKDDELEPRDNSKPQDESWQPVPKQPKSNIGYSNYERNSDKSSNNSKKPSNTREKQNHLRSYVENESSEEKENKGENREKTEHRMAIDAAGIQKVAKFEIKAGRVPDNELAHNTKGYDIQSWSKDESKIERFIEVKSTSSQWGGYGVKLSKAQHKMALEKGDRYWLYVVEFANSQNARIYCIQNPAGKITEYRFDDGWKSIAEKYQYTLVK